MDFDIAIAEQLQKALTCSADELFSIVSRAPGEVLHAALKNPLITESHLLAALRRRELSEESIRRIYRLPQTETSHSLQVAVASHQNAPPAVLLGILPHLHLFELLNLCLLQTITPDHRLAAERAIIQRLPMTPLGNRLTLARRATPLLLEALMKEGDPRLVEICLTNAKLKEGVVFQFLRSSAATAETISMVARNQRWQGKPNIREAILTNPRTPLIWFTLWLPGMKSSEVKRLLASSRLTPAMKKAVMDRLAGNQG